MYHCQSVFVMKLRAVLKAWSGCTWPAPNPWGLSGSHPWSRISA